MVSLVALITLGGVTLRSVIVKGTSKNSTFYRLARLVNKFGTFILLSVFSWYLADFHSVTMPALLLHLSQQSTQDKPRNQNKAIFRSALNNYSCLFEHLHSVFDGYLLAVFKSHNKTVRKFLHQFGFQLCYFLIITIVTISVFIITAILCV